MDSQKVALLYSSLFGVVLSSVSDGFGCVSCGCGSIVASFCGVSIAGWIGFVIVASFCGIFDSCGVVSEAFCRIFWLNVSAALTIGV